LKNQSNATRCPLDEAPNQLSPGKSRPGGRKILQKKAPVLVLIILALAVIWMLSFFGRSIIPGIPQTGRSIYILSIVIVVLIIIEFQS
jgi:hypothetical protein